VSTVEPNNILNKPNHDNVVFPHRVHLGYHPSSRSGHLYAVRRDVLCCFRPGDSSTLSCPTECRLSHSDQPWQCIVSLRFSTSADGQLLPQVRSEQFGSTIFDKTEVEERIRRAQRAILNPNTSFLKYLQDEDDDDTSTREVTFSRNCITLAISGSDVADLSFVDLPGESLIYDA
jgi:hypothetical protein